MRKHILDIDKMIEIEDWIDEISSTIIETDIPDEKLLEKLNLKLEYVDQDKFEPDTEAELRPCSEYDYFGLIRVSKKYINTKFAYIHEIIHYLKDVGVGNRVEKIYARKTKGNTKDDHEQEVNYATAAIILKYQDMKKYIVTYDKSKPKLDELKFINEICENYGQERTTVIRRIKEVRKLMKKRMSTY